MSLWKLLGMSKQERGGDPELGLLFEHIERILADGSAAEIKLVTGFAGLLGKVAYADIEVTAEESDRIRDVLGAELGLGPGPVARIAELLEQERARLFTIEDYIYTRLVNEVADREQKLALLRAMFAIAAADGSVRDREEQVIRIATKGLLLSHRDFIDARQQFRDHLAVLRKEDRR
jgi:uncharacterized tellurite resistance protein B-like protein